MDSLNDILSSLSPDDINSLKSMAESIFGSQNEKETAAPTGQSSGFNSINPEMLMKISSVMNMMKSIHLVMLDFQNLLRLMRNMLSIRLKTMKIILL